MRNLLAIAAMLALSATLATAQDAPAPEQGTPPTALVQRDGFWTANNAPPVTENFEVHVVQRGDTLWALAGRYLDNPFLWPQLWETNEHIVNPHWIYPEDRILIRPITRITEVEPPPPPEPEPEPEPVEEQVEAPRPVQLPSLAPDLGPPVERPALVFDLPEATSAPEVKVTDLYCSGFVRPAPVSRDLRVGAKASDGATSPGLYAVSGEYIYLSQGSADGVRPGDVFTAVRPTRDIDSPRPGVGKLGRHYLEIGQVETVTVQPEFSMARVVHSCDAISIGDALIPFTRIDFPELPSNRPFSSGLPSSGGIQGAIAHSQAVLLLIEPALGASTALAGVASSHLGSLSAGMSGTGEVVYIDLGARDGVQTGDLFLIYRPLALTERFTNVDSETREALARERQVIGELVVLKTEERAASALITFSVDGVSRGDRIERR